MIKIDIKEVLPHGKEVTFETFNNKLNGVIVHYCDDIYLGHNSDEYMNFIHENKICVTYGNICFKKFYDFSKNWKYYNIISFARDNYISDLEHNLKVLQIQNLTVKINGNLISTEMLKEKIFKSNLDGINYWKRIPEAHEPHNIRINTGGGAGWEIDGYLFTDKSGSIYFGWYSHVQNSDVLNPIDNKLLASYVIDDIPITGSLKYKGFNFVYLFKSKNHDKQRSGVKKLYSVKNITTIEVIMIGERIPDKEDQYSAVMPIPEFIAKDLINEPGLNYNLKPIYSQNNPIDLQLGLAYWKQFKDGDKVIITPMDESPIQGELFISKSGSIYFVYFKTTQNTEYLTSVFDGNNLNQVFDVNRRFTKHNKVALLFDPEGFKNNKISTFDASSNPINYLAGITKLKDISPDELDESWVPDIFRGKHLKDFEIDLCAGLASSGKSIKGLIVLHQATKSIFIIHHIPEFNEVGNGLTLNQKVYGFPYKFLIYEAPHELTGEYFESMYVGGIKDLQSGKYLYRQGQEDSNLINKERKLVKNLGKELKGISDNKQKLNPEVFSTILSSGQEITLVDGQLVRVTFDGRLHEPIVGRILNDRGNIYFCFTHFNLWVHNSAKSQYFYNESAFDFKHACCIFSNEVEDLKTLQKGLKACFITEIETIDETLPRPVVAYDGDIEDDSIYDSELWYWLVVDLGAKFKQRYLCLNNDEYAKYCMGDNVKVDFIAFSDIDEIPKIHELTAEDISNGKGIGLNPKAIKFKKS